MQSGIMLAVGLCLLCVGCGGGSSGDGGANQGGTTGLTVAQYCEQGCVKVHTCDSTQDTALCEARCNSGVSTNVRGDFLSKVAQCLDSKDCASILAGTAGEGCSDQALASLSVTAAGQSMCDALSSAVTSCGGNLDVAKCLNGTKVFSDAALERAKSCAQKPCGDIEPCVETYLN